MSAWVAMAMLAALASIGPGTAGPERPRLEGLDFRDVPARTKEFIEHHRSISLNAEQKKLKERVLGAIPAGCCRDYSILTCCCPCNFAKSVWGLANYAIVKLGYNEEELRRAVQHWVRAVNPSGFTGDACYRGGCGRSFAANGCGGMGESNLVF